VPWAGVAAIISVTGQPLISATVQGGAKCIATAAVTAPVAAAVSMSTVPATAREDSFAVVDAAEPAATPEESNAGQQVEGGEGGEGGAQHQALLEGRAYCFLPLPIRTMLPVHVNGYFELSSNRRDIWYGDDMDGEGRLRSQWNKALLEDIVPPCYARLLLAATQELGPGALYYGLWPRSVPPPPWKAVVDRCATC
jgi:hypothetical protein